MGHAGRINQVPVAAQIDLHDRVEILRLDMGGIDAGDARGDLLRAAQRDQQMRIVPADAAPVQEGVRRRCVPVAGSGDIVQVAFHPIAHRGDQRAARQPLEPRAGEMPEPFRLAIARRQKIAQRVAGHVLDLDGLQAGQIGTRAGHLDLGRITAGQPVLQAHDDAFADALLGRNAGQLQGLAQVDVGAVQDLSVNARRLDQQQRGPGRFQRIVKRHVDLHPHRRLLSGWGGSGKGQSRARLRGHCQSSSGGLVPRASG